MITSLIMNIKKGAGIITYGKILTNSGFSELAKIINKSGAEVDSVVTAPTWDNLKDLDIYIIVDPDTPLETSAPNYITPEVCRKHFPVG